MSPRATWSMRTTPGRRPPLPAAVRDVCGPASGSGTNACGHARRPSGTRRPCRASSREETTIGPFPSRPGRRGQPKRAPLSTSRSSWSIGIPVSNAASGIVIHSGTSDGASARGDWSATVSRGIGGAAMPWLLERTWYPPCIGRVGEGLRGGSGTSRAAVEPNEVAEGYAVGLEESAVDLDRPHGRGPRAIEEAGVGAAGLHVQEVDDPPARGPERDREWNQRVLHPEGRVRRAVLEEHHTGVGRERPASHEAALALLGRPGDLNGDRDGRAARTDAERAGGERWRLG